VRLGVRRTLKVPGIEEADNYWHLNNWHLN